MTNKRVTMQDIADACGLSRNTVSKVFNSRGAVPQTTKDTILQKAQELGYGMPAAETPRAVRAAAVKSIALLTRKMPANQHFAVFFFTSFTDRVCRAGYHLKMFEISPEELQQKQLPPHFNIEETAGMIGLELFDRDYMEMMCSIGLPTVFIDAPAHTLLRLMHCDYVSMENMAGMSAIVEKLISRGAKSIGFVGDREHCSSFYERWFGYTSAMEHAGLEVSREICLLEPDSPLYGDTDWLISRLDSMPFLPDAFVCCNDFIALHLCTALKKKGLSIPRDVMVTGFDDIPQSSMMDPALTTVHIPGADIGRAAASVLLNRIENPKLPYSWTRIMTTPIWRESTER